MVSFATLDVENAASVKRLVRAIDKANGYAMASVELERFEQIHALAGRAEPGRAGRSGCEGRMLRGGGACVHILCHVPFHALCCVFSCQKYIFLNLCSVF